MAPPRADDGSDSDDCDGGEQERQRQMQRKQEEEDDTNMHPLFWDAMPENPEDNPSYQAIQALREEATPEERANTYKVNGNKKLEIGLRAQNKVLLREAIGLYTQGLEEQCGDAKLDSVLCSNRAHVHSLLGNWRNCLEDAQRALKLDSTNVKACFRAARASLKLGRYELGISLAEQGRQMGPGAAKDFEPLEKEARAGLAKAQEQTHKEAQAREAKLAPVRALAATVAQRGYKITLPQVRTDDSWRPTLDPSTRRISWPCMILYPEAGCQDQIQAWDEEDTVGAQLDQMFAPDAPPLEWDTDQEYTRDAVELYYLSWAGKPLSNEQIVQWLSTGHWPDAGGGMDETNRRQKQQWVRVKEAWSLHQVLTQPDLVIPGVPLLALVSKKSAEYRARFLARSH